MKQTLILTTCLLIMQTGILVAGNSGKETAIQDETELTVGSSAETKALTTSWIEAFRMANPEAKIRVVTDEGAPEADIQIISSLNLNQSETRDSWKIVVGRDVIVPVMRSSDPCFRSVSGRGVSPSEFAALLSSDGIYTWGDMLGTGNNTPVTVVIPADDAALGAISAFASIDPLSVKATRSSSEINLSNLSQGKDGVIVFCRLADISARSGPEFTGETGIVPVDVNGNGRSDYFEQFYSDFDSFLRGVYIGKYPKSLYNNVYAVSDGVPARGVPSDFISFILIHGQRYLAEAGLTALARGEGVIRSEALHADQAPVTARDRTPVFKASLWILAIIAAVSLLSYLIYRFTRSGVKETETQWSKAPAGFSPGSSVTPAGILYDKGHAWTFMEKDGRVRVGVDDFLQHITGSFTRVRMKSNGEKIRKGEFVLSLIQNGKQLDIQSPVSGTIIARNERLMNDTTILHSSPYDSGWIYSVIPDNWEKESRMMSAANRYTEFLKEEFTRIKEFLTGIPGVNEVRLAQIVLQDGGELMEGLLEEFGPEIWEEFQLRFLQSRS